MFCECSRLSYVGGPVAELYRYGQNMECRIEYARVDAVVFTPRKDAGTQSCSALGCDVDDVLRLACRLSVEVCAGGDRAGDSNREERFVAARWTR